MGFLRRVNSVTLNDKVRSCEIHKTLNVESLLSIERSQLHTRRFGYMSSMSHEDWQGKTCWLHPRESGPEVVQGQGKVTTSPTLLGPVLVRDQQNYQRLLNTARYVESS